MTFAGLAALISALCLLAAPFAANAADNPIGVGIGALQNIGRVLRGDLDFVPASQGQFDTLAGDLGAATDLKSAGAALALGHGRFAVSLSGDRTATDDPDLWQAAAGDRRSALLAPRLGLAVGLGERLNVELAAMRLPGNDAHVLNAAASVSLLGDARTLPHLALRGSVGHLGGVDDVRVRTAGLELIAARHLWVLPTGLLSGYAGAGAVLTRARYSGDTPFRSNQTLDKWFVGVEAGSARLRAGLEAGLIDGRDYQSLRFSYLF